MQSELRIEGLEKTYGKKKVVKGVSFAMRSGEVVGLLGPNGAGKTTTFYMIVGFIKADCGRILIDGEDISKLPMYQRSARGLSYLPQEASIFRKLSVEDNIRIIMDTREDLSSSQKGEKVDELLKIFSIERLRKQKGYTLSGGERRRCEIARALATSPKFLLLDEPFAGIDPIAVNEIKGIVRKLSSMGYGVLLTDHNVRDALSITTFGHIISLGKIIVSGNKQELLSSPMARKIYFGQDFGGDDGDG